MNCNDIRSRLTEFRDGVLDEPAASAVREHLSTCAECRREWEQDGKFVMLLKSLRTFEACDEAEWPPDEPPHLDVMALERLAEYSSGELTDELRMSWRHVLECKLCYGALMRLRGPVPPVSMEMPPPPKMPEILKTQPVVMLINQTWHLVRQAIGQSLLISKEMLNAGIRLGESGNMLLQPVPVLGIDPLSIQVKVPEVQAVFHLSVDPSNESRWRIAIRLELDDQPLSFRVGLGDGGQAETGMKMLDSEKSETSFFINPPSKDGFSLCVQWNENGAIKESVVRIPVVGDDTPALKAGDDGSNPSNPE
ncbi:zf-HC2 domain-containing protein [Candidatus Sumerlaeota bacterium]|nr:zf-HC2 domain-containing protein [Candidatus Sumerlaeota bacterium]